MPNGTARAGPACMLGSGIRMEKCTTRRSRQRPRRVVVPNLILWFAAALLTAGLAHANADQVPHQAKKAELSNYWELVEAYGQGRRAEAVAELMRWDSARVRSEARRLLTIESENSLRTAVLLHTDALLNDAPPEEHFRVARDAVEKLRRRLGTPPDEGARRFCLGWYVVATGYLLFYGQDPRLAERLLDGPWQDAEVLLAQGSILEARFDNPPAFYRRDPGELNEEAWSAEPPLRERPEVLLSRAERNYRAALAQKPSCIEARLRLGRVLLLQGKNEAAFAELQMAHREAGSAHLRYLALLFMGVAHEESKTFEAALQAYEAAAREYPTSQASRLARANVLQALGRLDEARIEARQIFGQPRTAVQGAGLDPWWFYRAAQFWETERWMDELRAMMRWPQ